MLMSDRMFLFVLFLVLCTASFALGTMVGVETEKYRMTHLVQVQSERQLQECLNKLEKFDDHNIF